MKKLIVLILLIFFGCGKKESSENFLLKPQAFSEKIANTPGAIILDVRSPDEVRAEYIKGMVNFDFNAPEFDILISGMDTSKTYLVYCAKGGRSSKAADKMHDKNFTKVYLLDGGINAWKEAGLTTVKR